MQDMQEQMNSMNDSGEFQEVESNHSGRLSYVPSQPAVVPSPRSMNRDQSLRSDTWNLSGTQGNVFGLTNTISRNSSLYESKCYRWNPRAEEYRETCRER